MEVRLLKPGDADTLESQIAVLIGTMDDEGKDVDLNLVRATASWPNLIDVAAFDGNELVAIASGTIKQHRTGRELYVDDVVVKPSHRGRGLGEQLMNALRNYALEARCTAIRLTSSRPIAQALYRKLGYREVVGYKLSLR